MRASSRLLSLAVVVLVAAVAWLLWPRSSYAPVQRPSSLASWRAPWAEDTAAAASAGPRKWIVMGWDGASWDIILPLIEAGQLPHLAALMQAGSYGDLATIVPTQSPAVWTTIATGVSPARHGILGFAKPEPWWRKRLRALFGKPASVALFTNNDRRVRALWNVASEKGRSIVVVGYHNTFPVEEVNGAMVSNYLVREAVVSEIRGADAGRRELAPHLVFPARLQKTVAELNRRVEDVPWQEMRRFADIDEARFQKLMAHYRRSPQANLRWSYLCRAYAFDEFHARTALALQAELHPDFLLLHFQSTDWAGHNFLYFHEPERYADMPRAGELKSTLEAELPVYRKTVAAFYRFSDEWLGRLIESRSPDTAVMVVSDHGMERQDYHRETGTHNDGPAGIVVIAGPGVRPGHRLNGATVYDVLPTLAAASGLPVARDLQGHVLRDAFGPASLPVEALEWVATYESGGRRYVPRVDVGAPLHEELENELRGLGYIQ